MLIFEPCINAFHLRPFEGFKDPCTTFYDQNILCLTQNRDFSKSRAVLTQELLGRIVAESLEKFRPNRGVGVNEQRLSLIVATNQWCQQLLTISQT
jgi:hypothetical protein